MTWQLNKQDQQLIQLALHEDLGDPYCDLTAHYLLNNNHQRVSVISKHHDNLIFCGQAVIEATLQLFEQTYDIKMQVKDGQTASPGQLLLIIDSNQQTLSMSERVVLNFLQHLCAIATLTNQFVKRVEHSGLKILDTRKTLPGFRHFDKYAVHCGGGVNHRMGLYDALMIKDNHIDFIGGMVPTLAKLPDDILQQHDVIVEVRNQQELAQLIDHGQGKVSRVLLDNMSPTQLQQCVKQCRGIFATEASGGINIDNIAAVANSGVDFASVGAITHSAGNLDLSMIQQPI